MKAKGTFLFAALLLAGWASPVIAQVPTATDEQREAGSRVTEVVFEPAEIEMVRGDSVAVTPRFLDENGEEVEDVVFRLFSFRGPISPHRDSTSNSYMLVANGPGSADLRLGLMMREEDANDFGQPGLKVFQGLSVTIDDWPIEGVHIDPPAYRAYVGSSFRLAAHVMTDHGVEHGTAEVAWSSRNTNRAIISPAGVVRFNGTGGVELVAETEGGISESIRLDVQDNPVRQITLTPTSTETRTGDVVHFSVTVLDARGRAVDSLALSYSVFGLDSAGAVMYEDGAFVAENPGAYRVIVSGGGQAVEALVVAEARPEPSEVTLVGRGPRAEVSTSDLWVFEGQDGRDYAYTGTHAQGGGQRMFVWDVTDPENVELIDSVVVDARVVNDVKVNGDASWAVITREGASSRRNGIVVLDIRDPAHPEIIAEFTDSLTGGVHNVWINGDVLYAVNSGRGLMSIIDMSDPYNPRYHGKWELREGETNKFLHDVWADGRYAYVSYWDDGLVILDVGAGTHGGTALDPAFVSNVSYAMGNTHTAWQDGNYVFVGDELQGPSGYIHVYDLSDINNPVEVARYDVPEAGAHNIWVENGLLYVAYYNGGLRIVDVTGELRGDLYRQGREVGRYLTRGAEDESISPNDPLAWGPQLFKGNVFVTDINSGLWVLKHQRAEELSP